MSRLTFVDMAPEKRRELHAFLAPGCDRECAVSIQRDSATITHSPNCVVVPPHSGGCRGCGRPTFGPLCAKCKGER